MSFATLSIDNIEYITHKIQTPRDLLRLMLTCKSFTKIVKRHPIWYSLRTKAGLPSPKPRATLYKSDFDVFMRVACRSCFRKSSSGKFTKLRLCDKCYEKAPEVQRCKWLLESSQDTLRLNGRKQKKLQRELEEIDKQERFMKERIIQYQSNLKHAVDQLSFFTIRKPPLIPDRPPKIENLNRHFPIV